jgi:phosphomethylpyrimidine synthase
MKTMIGDIELKSGDPVILTHVGLTYDAGNISEELKKARVAIKHGASIIADVSLGKNALCFIKELCNNVAVPITVLPGYLLATENDGNELPLTLSKNQILEMTEKVLSYGVKGFTIHSAFRQKHLPLLDKTERIIPFTSRMGNYIRKHMLKTNKENPFYECFPEIINLAKKYNATISIGTALRSPSIANNGGFDCLMKNEILEASSLIEACYNNNVNVILEGVGHISIDKITEWFDFSKNNCHNVILRVLPMVTDLGMGHDNVTGAIAICLLAKKGVEVVCSMTRAEHVGHPTIADIKESVIHARIALASAFPDFDKELKVAEARNKGGCNISSVLEHVIDSEGALDAIQLRIKKEDFFKLNFSTMECSMCGISCPLK